MKFEIQIGQQAIMGMPYGETFIIFCTEENKMTVRLVSLVKAFNTILESKGNRSKKSYDAKKEIDQIFGELANMIEREINKTNN